MEGSYRNVGEYKRRKNRIFSRFFFAEKFLKRKINIYSMRKYTTYMPSGLFSAETFLNIDSFLSHFNGHRYSQDKKRKEKAKRNKKKRNFSSEHFILLYTLTF